MTGKERTQIGKAYKMATENSREIVLDMLLMVEREEVFSHRIIKDVLYKYDYLTGQEKAFIKRLFEGTLERRIELDYALDGIASMPVKKMKPFIRNLLRMSAYQIIHMDGVPDSAAINEAVKLAGKRKFQNLKGFVNGVLRKLSAQKEMLPVPSEEKEPESFLSVTFSMPEWLVRHFLSRYSYEEVKALLAGLLQVRPVTVRFAARLTKLQKEELADAIQKKGVSIVPHPYVKQACYLEGCENLTELPGFWEGAFTVQDASSMLAVAAAGIKQGDSVLDVCAAPGGKTLLAAEYAGESGHVEARDISDYKVALIEENAARMKQHTVFAKVWDATQTDEKALNTADVVLADVPCSGLGVMGKKRDIKYRQTPEALKNIIHLQQSIVRQAAAYVKPGGTLLYSTCTINYEENEGMADWMEKTLGLVLEPFDQYMDGLPKADTAKKGYLQLLPQDHDTDGFFVAKFKKPLS